MVMDPTSLNGHIQEGNGEIQFYRTTKRPLVNDLYTYKMHKNAPRSIKADTVFLP
jgi:hypothetical protein